MDAVWLYQDKVVAAAAKVTAMATQGVVVATKVMAVAYTTLQTVVLGTSPLTIYVKCLAKKGDIY